MTTIRSEYSIEQFEEVFQKMACEIVSKETGIECKVRFGKFHKVNTADITLEFRYRDDGSCRRISVRHHKSKGTFRCCGKTLTRTQYEEHIKEAHEGKSWYGWEDVDQWGFGVESKLYLSSSHVSKIDTGDEKEKVLEWINEVMTTADVKPVPRFSLSTYP